MVAQVARKLFNVPKVLARVFDPRREKVYREFDIETVSPTNLMAQAFVTSIEKKQGDKSCV
jgi:trk system potassium uptake protein TrkA